MKTCKIKVWTLDGEYKIEAGTEAEAIHKAGNFYESDENTRIEIVK